MTLSPPPLSDAPRVDGQFINVASPAQAVAAVRERAAAGRGFTFFTLNLDHLVKLRDHPGFRAAYRAANLVSADGWPVALLTRRKARSPAAPAVQVTTGADLVVPLCAAAATDRVPVYLFGATEKSLSGAAAALRAANPGLDIRGWHAPPYGFDPLSPEADAEADRIAASGARLVFLALGAPKQELFAARVAARHPALGLVCIGAALDFLSGIQVRAPRLVRAARLEWLWRLVRAPRVLGRRYARCAGLLATLAVVEPALRALGVHGRPKAGRAAAGAPARYRICLMHTMDPRGATIGGIETHIRQFLRHHPADVSALFVGLDEVGDCTLGQVRPLVVEGRTIDFLPVARIGVRAVNHAAKRVAPSTTLPYLLGALRHLGAIRRAIGPGPATADLHRFAFAPLARLLGLPALQMVHREGDPGDKRESLIKSDWFLHTLGERLALRWATGIFCVDPAIVARIATEFPRALPKAEVLTVSVDTGLFSAQPFACEDGVFRLVFAGRLDAFKDPSLMFATVAALRARLGGKVELHYVGASDPTRFPEFAAIRDVTVRHGFQDAAGVARIMALCHAGILTAFFAGMPCFLLEGLASGRPFGAIRLPPYDRLIEAGTSGFLVERADTTAASAEALADGFADLWDAIRHGRLDPQAIHAKTAPYAVTAQMSRLFAHHRTVQGHAMAVTPVATLA